MKRRHFLGLAAGVGALPLLPRPAALGPGGDLERLDLVVGGDSRLARRALVLVPKHTPPGTRFPLAVLLHGLGETGNEELGIRAWADRYGLVRCYERLRRPPVGRTLDGPVYLTDSRVLELNATLSREPFEGFAIVCPVTPSPRRHGDPASALDQYADWLVETLLPAVRGHLPVHTNRASTILGGCSLGGYVGLEVLLRRPEAFGAFAGVQAAFSVNGAAGYADRIAAAKAPPGGFGLLLETSTRDPYRRANEVLGERLRAKGIAHDLLVPPGPHDQPWLREVGSLELLLWCDRRLRPAQKTSATER